jgi:CRISPR-associated protein Cmr4
MAVKLLFVHALTSIHAGTGQGVGTIDLPIARERATFLPVVPGSTLKGCLRSGGQVKDEALRDAIFGKEDEQGRFRIGDARLLLLPVRSLSTVFAWTTSPYVLRRFLRDCELLGLKDAPNEIPDPSDKEALSAGPVDGILIGGKPKLVFEDFDFDIRPDKEDKPNHAAAWGKWLAGLLFPDHPGWRGEFLKRFVVLHDSVFDHLCEYATEVNAHISIGESGTVERGALWYEETLPAETVLVSVFDFRGAAPEGGIIPDVIRLGGNETTGNGLARLVAWGES